MIKNLRPVDGSEQLEEELWGREPVIQGKPCLCILMTAPAAAVAPLFHVAITSHILVEHISDTLYNSSVCVCVAFFCGSSR